MRKLTFAQAKSRYPLRFTMENVPKWSAAHAANGKFYAPQYATDLEWYDKTLFPGDESYPGIEPDCYSRNASFPLGIWLDAPFQKPG